MRGQISLGIGLILAVSTTLVSATGAYYSAQISVNDKIGTVSIEVAQLKAKEDTMRAWLTRVETKLDRVIETK